MCHFVHCFVTTVPLFRKLGGGMIYEVTGRKTVKTSSHADCILLFSKWHGGSDLLLPSITCDFPDNLASHFDKTRKNDAPHLFKKLHFLAKRGSCSYSSKHGDTFVADCPSFVGEKPHSLYACLSFVSRSVSAVSSADTMAARRPSPPPRSPLPSPSPCHKLLLQAPH